MSSFPIEENAFHWWLCTGHWDRLHAIPKAAFDPNDEDAVDALTDYPGPEARAVCGHEGGWQMPGVFTRIGAPRCAHCCDQLGIPRGEGTPNNAVA